MSTFLSVCRSFAVSCLILGALSGCAVLEMPENDQGNHPMKPSPCACDPIPYNSEGYKWLG
jgi:hypothetical protein